MNRAKNKFVKLIPKEYRNSPAIYKIKNKITEETYIGGCSIIRKRFCSHYRELNENKHHCKILQESWNKYGEDNFEFEILEFIIDSSILKEREQYWMDQNNCLLNVFKFARSGKGLKHSEETKKLIGDGKKGITTYWRKGVPLTKEHRENIGKANKGKKMSEEQKEHLRQINKGKTRSEESKQKMLNSEGYKNRKRTLPKGKRVEQYDIDGNFIKTWDYMKDAAKAVERSSDSILQCIKGKSKQCGGYIWKFVA